MMRSGFLFAAMATAAAGLSGSGEAAVRQWEVFEIECSASSEMANPYAEGLPDKGEAYLKAVFKQEGSGGKEYTMAGFWDGGRTWRVRFAPPLPGEWTYLTVSKDSGLNGKKGRFACQEWAEKEKKVNSTRRGFLRVAHGGPRPGRTFEYADGTPFFWLGDTWWNWTKRKITFDSFRKLADDRAEKGFSVGHLFFAGSGWGRESSSLDRTYTHPDIEHIRSIERMIAYANEKGITVWVHGWWSQPRMNERVGEENMRRWWRYLVHRLAAYNVIWVLAGEYNMHNYGGLGLPFWKKLGKLIKAEDPYDRIVSAHPTPPGWEGGADAPQWSTTEVLHKEGWLDYNQSQVGHGRWRNEMIPWVVEQSYRRKPPKPIVVTEPWYEFIEGNPTAQDIRFGAWSAILSGAAGHSYAGGHVWKAHVPEAPAGADTWPMEMGFEANTLDYPGARSLGFMTRFLRSVPWWTLEPHPERVSENPSRYCAAVPGERYLVYLRWGGVAKIDLRPSNEQDAFRYEWLDLTADRKREGGSVGGGAVRAFAAPGDYPGTLEAKDWVLHIYRAEERR
ncbi:MAG: DUF4038 domain-containing protein [Armatimonadetes bacterium]|nr:DUF4038 domain-containing protein [Armatimonadota bacterium]